jgi:PAS domain S-box-containing protein
MIQSESKYRNLFECLSEAALLTDLRSGRVIDTNHQAEILFGKPRSQVLGSNIERLLSPGTLAEFRTHFADHSHDTGERILFEGEIPSVEGTAVPVAISATRIDLYGRHLVLGLYRDVTERKRAEAEIERLKAELAARES